MLDLVCSYQKALYKAHGGRILAENNANDKNVTIT